MPHDDSGIGANCLCVHLSSTDGILAAISGEAVRSRMWIRKNHAQWLVEQEYLDEVRQWIDLIDIFWLMYFYEDRDLSMNKNCYVLILC